MKTIDVCGKRGLGDLISSIPIIIYSQQEDTHIKFHYPDGFGYNESIRDLMEELILPSDICITHEVVHDHHTINFSKACTMYGIDNYLNTWYFTQSQKDPITKFKNTWNKNTNSYIALAINNEGTSSNHPFSEKWFAHDVNQILSGLIDNKNFVLLGRPLSVKENFQLLYNCKFALGVDGAWAHAAKYTNTPYYLVRNNFSTSLLRELYPQNSNIKIIETHEIFDYI